MIAVELERNEVETDKGSLWLVYYLGSTRISQLLLAKVVHDPQTTVLGLASVHPILGQYVVFNNSLPPEERLVLRSWGDVKVLGERLGQYLKDLAMTLHWAVGGAVL